MQVLYAHLKNDNSSFEKSEKELLFSIQKTYELYHYLLILVIEFSKIAEQVIETRKLKHIPSHEDLNPNTKFIDNKVIQQIRINKQLQSYTNAKKISWVNYYELVKKLYNEMLASQKYIDYMNNPERSYNEDKALISDLFQEIICPNEMLEQVLEEQSIYWNDELEFVISMLVKTFEKFKEKHLEDAPLLELYKNDEDREFVRVLFRRTLMNFEENTEQIKKYTDNWDVERIAFLDIILLNMALTETMEFSSVPTKVTFNEYIELSKFYSTEKSSGFINGILDKMVTDLKKDNKIVKLGRGLLGEA